MMPTLDTVCQHRNQNIIPVSSPIICGLKRSDSWKSFFLPNFELLDELQYSTLVIEAALTHEISLYRLGTRFSQDRFDTGRREIGTPLSIA
jgi:hypothetical protein